MATTLQKIFQAIMQTEEPVLPIFIHDPVTQKIAGAVVVTESIFGEVFGINPLMPPPPVPEAWLPQNPPSTPPATATETPTTA